MPQKLIFESNDSNVAETEVKEHILSGDLLAENRHWTHGFECRYMEKDNAILVCQYCAPITDNNCYLLTQMELGGA